MSHRSTCTYAFWLFTLISSWGSGGSHREANLVSGAGADCVDAARKIQLFIMCPHHSLVCFCWIFSSRDLRMLQCWQSHPLVQVYSVQPHKCNKKEKKSKLLYGLGNCGLFYWKLLGFSQRHKKNLLSILCYFIYLATFWLYLVTVYHTIAPNVSS